MGTRGFCTLLSVAKTSPRFSLSIRNCRVHTPVPLSAHIVKNNAQALTAEQQFLVQSVVDDILAEALSATVSVVSRSPSETASQETSHSPSRPRSSSTREYRESIRHVTDSHCRIATRPVREHRSSSC